MATIISSVGPSKKGLWSKVVVVPANGWIIDVHLEDTLTCRCAYLIRLCCTTKPSWTQNTGEHEMCNNNTYTSTWASFRALGIDDIHDPRLRSAPSWINHVAEDVSTGHMELRLSAPEVDCRHAWKHPSLRPSFPRVPSNYWMQKLKKRLGRGRVSWGRERPAVCGVVLARSRWRRNHPTLEGGGTSILSLLSLLRPCERSCRWGLVSRIDDDWVMAAFQLKARRPVLSTLQPGRATRHPMPPIAQRNVVGVLGAFPHYSRSP